MIMNMSCRKEQGSVPNSWPESSDELVSINFLNLTDTQVKSINRYIGNYKEDPAHYPIPEEEMNLEILILKQYLKANHYKTVDSSTFNKRINEIFDIEKRKEKGEHEIIDYPHFFCISSLYYENYSKLSEQEKISIIKNDGLQSGEYMVFARNYNFIIDPSDISEYFEPLAWWEGKLLPLKKEFERHLHRNKYLFNDDPFSLVWLLKNDIEFLRDLVDYGYDKEPKINRAVLKNIYNWYTETQPRNEKKLNHLFADKDCNGQLQIREGLLKYILETTTVENNDLLTMLNDYCRKMIYTTPEESGFTQSEIFKIVAYTGYYVEAAYDKNEIWARSYVENWNQGSAFYNEIIGRGELWEEIKRNNYYGLSGFEDMIKAIFNLNDERYEEYMRTHNFDEIED
jgi:hypothetical protein